MKNLIVALLLFTTSLTFAHKEKWDDNKKNWSPLMLAIYKGETKEFKRLIKSNADVNYKVRPDDSNWNLTPLEVAIRMDNEVAVNCLLSTNKILKPESYLMTAAGQNSVRIIELLIQYGANPNETLENGYSVLMMATASGSKEVLECLLKNGGNPNQAEQQF
ncbi:MAG: ankyrin repeat domain-containing protein [Flavobacterium sp.]